MKSENTETGQKFFVYALSDPRSVTVHRYYGCTCDVASRLSRHRSSRFASYDVRKWIAALREERLCPSVTVIEEFMDEKKALERERQLIISGQNLLNKRNVPTEKRLKTLAEVERETIIETVSICNGNKVAAAESLGIGRQTLYNKLNEYNLPAHCLVA